MSGHTDKTVCCCCSLRTANLVLGWIYMVGSTLFFVLIAAQFIIDHLHPEAMDGNLKNLLEHERRDFYLNMFGVVAVISGCQLYGIYTLRREFLMPAMVSGTTELLFGLGMLICTFRNMDTEVITSKIFILLMYFYFHYIQFEFYKTVPSNRQSLVNEEESMT